MTTPFIDALCSPGPAAEHADKLALYGRFVGAWEAQGEAIAPDGSRQPHWWHIRFAWVLEGRAVQDVWITPVRNGPRLGQSHRSGPFSDQYGTSLRVYDPARDLWDVTWIDPHNHFSARLTGRAEDGGIYQEGVGSNGMRLRWIFSNIAADRFHWRAEVSQDGGSWRRVLELKARRTAD